MNDIRIQLALGIIIAALIGAVIALSLSTSQASAPTKGYFKPAAAKTHRTPAVKASAPRCSYDGNYANDVPGCV